MMSDMMARKGNLCANFGLLYIILHNVIDVIFNVYYYQWLLVCIKLMTLSF